MVRYLIRYCRVYSTSWVLRHQRQHRAVWPAKPCRGCRRCCWRRSPVRRTRRGVGWTRISSTASTTCRSTRAPRARARRSGWPAACRTPSWRSRRGASRRRAAAASTTGSSTSLRPRSPGTKVATSSRSSTLGRPTWCRGWHATTRWRAAARTAAASRRRGDACGRTTGRCARPPAASPACRATPTSHPCARASTGGDCSLPLHTGAAAVASAAALAARAATVATIATEPAGAAVGSATEPV